MTNQVTTRPLKDDDVIPVLDLLRAALGEPPLLKRTPELFKWKHFENSFGKSIALVAESGGRIAGLRALMRWELKTKEGATLRCVRAVDTATHPDFHRRGIFRRLTEEAIEAARADGVDLVFNTPNERSGAGYLSMGWEEVGRVGVMLRPSWRLPWRRSDPSLATDTSRFLDAPTLVTRLAVEDRPPRGLRTPRNAKYLHWRFAAHPTARYFRVDKGESVAIVRPNIRNEKRELILADVFGAEPSEAIREVMHRSKADYVATWFSKGSPERRASIRSGVVPIPGVATLTLMARSLGDLDVDVRAMESWDLAISDLELL